ncbi:hypothetical protein MWU60_06675 [Yoonia sp. F2084L]|uniref:hypothetical protein n=1 Tax=Yoonia sp. F2084L TaxID=2926419 RepID=UPI001FF3C37A|nr:hypothetical protein [Yoonia sp. F2084L]MCK0095249.1 hypothetical protein [Yoonia sp. F2084L]
MTYSLDPSDKGTKLGITVAASSFSGPETLQEFRQGWGGGLDNLERYAAKVSADA